MSKQNTKPQQEDALSGLVERVTYHNADTGFCVLQAKVRGHRKTITIVGHAPTITAGEFIQATGLWINDKSYGQQFRCSFLKPTPPTTIEGIEKYLGSGMIKGIGPIYAKRLIRVFGEKVFDIIEEDPKTLRTVSGIGKKKANAIIKGWSDQKSIREIMLFLHQYGVSTARAVRIFKTYGSKAIEIISENPYQLARDIKGIGFVSADTIAQEIGIEKTSQIRARAGISYALMEAMGEGHCGLPRHDLIKLTQKLLAISPSIVEEGLSMELSERNVIADSVQGIDCIFLSQLYHVERQISERLFTLKGYSLPWQSIDTDKALEWVEEKLSINLAAVQKEAVHLALQSKVCVITGGPGVGKTTLVKSILQILAAKNVKISLCAPTGRAAKRLSESTNMSALTIHRLLEPDGFKGGFRCNEHNTLKTDLLIVDEVSMVDVFLMNSLLKALPSTAALVLVGDIDQLPSVGPGQVLSDIILSGKVPVVRLTEVFRQASNSKIITNAHRINKGLLPSLATTDSTSDFFFIEAISDEDGVDKVLKIVCERIPQRFGFDPKKDIQVLCPMNRGGLGVHSLNIALKKVLNPGNALSIQRFGTTFSVGDKVMQIENDYEKDVYNGDIGFITSIDLDTDELGIKFDERLVVYDFGELDSIVLAYATSIHKSQGSEFPAVVLPLVMQHYPMLKKNLVYTGITRGKSLVVIIGQKKALSIAVKGKQQQKRWSKLEVFLKNKG